MNDKHKCNESNAKEKIEKHLKDKKDPFNNTIIEDYVDQGFNFKKVIDQYKLSQEKALQNLQIMKKENYNDFLKILGEQSCNNNYITLIKNSNEKNYNNEYYSNVKIKNDKYSKKGNYKVVMKEYGSESNSNYNNLNYNDNAIKMNSFKTSEFDPFNKIQKPYIRVDDYVSYFETHKKSLFDYIKCKILKEEYEEKDVTLTKYIVSTLIARIDKSSDKDTVELYCLMHLGIDYNIILEILQCFVKKDTNELSNVLNKLSVNKVLMVYKYLEICFHKYNKAFYKECKFFYKLSI